MKPINRRKAKWTTRKHGSPRQKGQRVSISGGFKSNTKPSQKYIPKLAPVTKPIEPQPPKLATATYNKATGWINLSFSGVPPENIRADMKAQGFRYRPYGKRWIATFTPDRQSFAKQLGGGTIEEVNIEPNYAAKAEYMADKAEKHREESNRRFETAHKIGDMIPFGQPILVGHHSEGRHRRDLERIDSNMGKSVEEQKKAEEYQRRAERYGKMATGESPATIFNRIKKLEADSRVMERRLASDDYPDKEHSQKWLDHYQQRLTIEREKYKASGGIATDSMVIKTGDVVNTRWGKATVMKVNTSTVRVEFHNPALRMGGGGQVLAKTDIRGEDGKQ